MNDSDGTTIKKAKDFEQEAMQHLQGGRIGKAETVLSDAVETFSDDPTLLNNLGVVRFRLGKYELAREHFEKALSVNSSYPDALQNLKKVRLNLLQQRIENAFNRYRLGQLHYLTSYVNQIKSEYLRIHQVTIPVANRLKMQIEDEKDGKQEILFIDGSPRVELAKMADALRATGRYRVRLLCASHLANIVDGFYYQHFDEIIGYQNLLELMYFLLALQPDLILARPKSHIGALSIIFGNAPVVYHMYDVISFWYDKNNGDPLTLEADQFALMHAEGILYKDSPAAIEEHLKTKYNIRGKVLNFLPYCWERYFAPVDAPKLSEKDGEIHIVYTGQVQPPTTDKRIDRPIHFIETAEALTKQGLHLHIYYSPHLGQSDDYYRDYFNLAEKNRRFHFHTGLGYSDLCTEIARYDYGWSVHDFRGTINSPLYIKTCIGNRIFTYMEAGLPTIVSENLEYSAEFVNQHQIGLSINPYDFFGLAEKLKSIDYAQLKRNVAEKRNVFNLNNHIDQLIDMFESIMSENPHE